MKYYNEKEIDETIALHTLATSDNKEWAKFAKDALKEIESVGIEISVNDDTIVDIREKDDDSTLANYIVAYDEYIESHINDTENFKIIITIISLLTGEIIFESKFETFNKGESINKSEYCSRKSLYGED
jgi:hypothetical protein